jgi:hypothetical protein
MGNGLTFGIPPVFSKIYTLLASVSGPSEKRKIKGGITSPTPTPTVL